MGRTSIDRILRAVEKEPWALQPEKLQQIAEILAQRAEHGSFPTASEIEAIEARQRSKVQSAGAIAVLPLFGTISRRLGMLGAMSGGASVETFQKSFREAMADDSVSSILLDIDSPGGSVYGIEETARMILDARKTKRVVAVANQVMASAAYYIGAAADELVATPSSEVGSIGVFMVHFDWSGAMEDAGIVPTIIKAGDRKTEGNPYGPLDEEAAAHFQSIIDDYYGMFLRAVSRGRGVPIQQVRDRFGQGLTFTAQRALERGMVDRVATFEEVVEDMQKGRTRKAGSKAATVPVAIDLAAEGYKPELFAASDATSVSVSAVEVGPELNLTGLVESATKLVSEALSKADTPAPTKIVATEAPQDEPTAAAGRAATERSDPAPTEPAPEAREEPMSGVDTAAPTQGSDQNAVAAAVQAERERVRQIRELGAAHKIDAADVDRWVDDGLDTDQANAAALLVLQSRESATPRVTVGAEREGERKYRTLGEQLKAVFMAEQKGARVDPRLMEINAAATGSGEAVPSDGGFLLEPEFSNDILTRVYDTGEVASRVRRRPIGPNSSGLKLKAIDETSRVTGSRYGGIQMYWANEGDTVTASKPKFRVMELSLHKLFGIWYVTEELLEDSTALQANGEDAFREETTFMVENSIFRGTGAGQPLGILNAGSLVTVDAESAQTAATINETNVVKMLSRLWSRSRQTSAWFINQDAEPQLPLMTIGDQPVYLPPGGLRDNPFGTLLGRPVIPVEYAATLGAVGDICLFDLDQYYLIDKDQVKTAWSIHVRFINDEQTFKITYRVDGQPLWNQALTPFQGSNTQSPFVVLAART